MASKKKPNEFQMESISSHSSNIQNTILDHDNQESLRDVNKEKEKLNSSQVQIQNQQLNQPSRLESILRHKKLFAKWLTVVLIFTCVFLIIKYFFIVNLQRSRHPIFLWGRSVRSDIQIMSPQQSDYKSFLFYLKMIDLSKMVTFDNRPISSQDIKQFQNITFRELYNSYKVIRTVQLAKEYSRTEKEKEEMTEQVDITTLDVYINKTEYFSDAVDQFQCASCYSFPITATIQYLYKKKYNITVKLSEQQLIDCVNQDPDVNGCEEGNITKSFEYVQKNGLVTAEQYPYRSIIGKSFKCDTKTIERSKKKYKISAFKKLPMRNCQAIQVELVKDNVVAAMINAGDLSSYSSGTFTDCKRVDLNHAITIVGQTEKGEWIVRNSWGKGFGQNGYFVMGHGNTCGVCTYSFVPFVNLDKNGEIIPGLPQEQVKNQNI